MKKIGIIVGSTRKESNSLKIAQNVLGMLEGKVKASIIEIGNLPLYNQDYDSAPKQPRAYTTFRKAIAKLDGVIIVTPEHNRSMPSALKNAFDVASRPWGQGVWGNKKYMVIGNSMGKLSAFGAVMDVNKILTYFGGRIMAQPEVYLGPIGEVLTADGKLLPGVHKFVGDVVTAFLAFK